MVAASRVAVALLLLACGAHAVLSQDTLDFPVVPMSRSNNGALTCDGYDECPANRPLKSYPERRSCSGTDGSCTKKDCCRPTPRTCEGFKCPLLRPRKSNPGEISCTGKHGGRCKKRDCCERPPTCKSYTCPAGHYLKDRARKIKCQDISCTDTECCSESESADASPCAGYECPSGFFLLEDPELPETCAGDPCLDTECCAETQANASPCGGYSCPAGFSLLDVLPETCEGDPCLDTECCGDVCPAGTTSVVMDGMVLCEKTYGEVCFNARGSLTDGATGNAINPCFEIPATDPAASEDWVKVVLEHKSGGVTCDSFQPLTNWGCIRSDGEIWSTFLAACSDGSTGSCAWTDDVIVPNTGDLGLEAPLLQDLSDASPSSRVPTFYTVAAPATLDDETLTFAAAAVGDAIYSPMPPAGAGPLSICLAYGEGLSGIAHGDNSADANCVVTQIFTKAPTPEACVCTQEWEPVCGTDGNEYGNDCEAGCAGVEFTTGPCPDR